MKDNEGYELKDWAAWVARAKGRSKPVRWFCGLMARICLAFE